MSCHAPLVYKLSSSPCWIAGLQDCAHAGKLNEGTSKWVCGFHQFSVTLRWLCGCGCSKKPQPVGIHLQTPNDCIKYVCVTHLCSIQCNLIKYASRINSSFLKPVLFVFSFESVETLKKKERSETTLFQSLCFSFLVWVLTLEKAVKTKSTQQIQFPQML